MQKLTHTHTKRRMKPIFGRASEKWKMWKVLLILYINTLYKTINAINENGRFAEGKWDLFRFVQKLKKEGRGIFDCCKSLISNRGKSLVEDSSTNLPLNLPFAEGRLSVCAEGVSVNFLTSPSASSTFPTACPKSRFQPGGFKA